MPRKSRLSLSRSRANARRPLPAATLQRALARGYTLTRRLTAAYLASGVADGRQWHPEGRARPEPATRGLAARTIAARAPHNPWLLTYEQPQHVLRCQRAKQRRQVLFALDLRVKSGQGYKREKKPNNGGAKCLDR